MRYAQLFLLTCLGAVALTACPQSEEKPVKPTITRFTVTPERLPAGGGQVTLSWVADGADSLSVNPGVGTVTGTTKSVSVTANTTFTLVASNKAGSATMDAAVTVAQEPAPVKDTTSPSLASSLPAAGASNVAVNTGLSVQFSEAMNPASVKLEISPAVDLGAPSWDAAKTTVSFTPAAKLAENTAYTLTVNGNDAAGNALEPKKIGFKTAEPATITLSGRVIGQDNQPAAGAPVILLGDPARTVTTGSDGRFSFDKVSAPYDVAVVNGATSTTRVLMYKGLTRKDPTLAFLGFNYGNAHSAWVSGSLTSAGGSVSTEGRRFRCAFEVPSVTTYCSLYSNPYGAYLAWNGDSALIGTAHVISWYESGTTRGEYLYGKRNNVAVSDSGNVSNLDISLNAIASAALSGSVTMPANYTAYYRDLYLDFADGASTYLFSDYPSNSSFSLVTPVIDGSTLSLSTAAYGSQGELVTAVRRQLPSNANGIKLTLPNPPTLALPGNNANGIDPKKQAFSWAPMTGSGLTAVHFQIAESLDMIVLTAGSSLTLPKPDDLNLGSIFANARVSWWVSGYSASSIQNIDAFAAPDGLTLYRTTDLTQGDSSQRNFTTN